MQWQVSAVEYNCQPNETTVTPTSAAGHAHHFVLGVPPMGYFGLMRTRRPSTVTRPAAISRNASG